MKYSDANLQSSLAAEYVLGTLRGSARKRFETLKVKDRKMQDAVHYWESQLNEMASIIEPVSPPIRLWHNIEKSLGFYDLDSGAKSDANNVVETEQVPEELVTESSANQTWKTLSGLAVAASLVLSILFYQYSNDIRSPESVAVFANTQQQTLWSVDIRKHNLFIRGTQNLEKRADNDYQLWIVPASGDAPISVGILKQEGAFTLPKPEVFDQIQVAALAVSLEPKGGSPTGSPTEVLFASELAQL